jgi:hypothetical protein
MYQRFSDNQAAKSFVFKDRLQGFLLPLSQHSLNAACSLEFFRSTLAENHHIG